MEEKRKEKIELIRKSFELKYLKKYKEALELLYKALEYDDYNQDSVELLSQIGDLHIQLKNYDRALDEFQKALAVNKHHQHSIQKCYDIYFMTEQYQKALKSAKSLFSENQNTESAYNLIQILIKLENYQEAMDIFNSLDEELKLDCNILYLISTISKEKRKLILEKIISLDETHEEANIDLAEIEFNKGNYDEVIKYCINIEQDNPLALYFLAVIESKKKNYSKAIELFLKAIELDNDKHDFYFELAKTYINISWLSEALTMLKRSINWSLIKDDNKNLDEKYLLSAWILIRQKQYSKALLNLNSIPESSAFYNNAKILTQAVNLENMDIATVIKELEQLHSSENDNPFLLDTLAAAYKELKLYKKAIDIYDRALKYYPESIYYNLEIIDLLIDDKNYQKAFDMINNFITKYQNCANIYNSIARIYYRLNKLDEANYSLDEYLKLNINNPEVYYFKGLILNDLTRFQEAKTMIYNAIKLDPTKAKYYSQMARSYCGLKEYDSALLYVKEAIEIDQNEISYKKQAYDISVLSGSENQIQIFKNQLKRSEEILKMNRNY